MRVAFTTDYFPPHVGGGVEAVVREVSRRLAADGHDVLVVTLGREGWPSREMVDGVLVRRFASARLNRLTGLELSVSLEAFRKMRSTIGAFAPDVVNAHHQYFTTTPAALKAAKDLQIPSVLTLHIAGLEAFSGWRGAASRGYESLVARHLVTNADALVAVSDAVARAVSTRPGQVVRVIPNGVDLARFHPAESPSSLQRFVFVGRLIANKGPQLALEAFRLVRAQAPHATMTMVGDGPMMPMLRRFVEDHDLGEQVRFVGMRHDVANVLREGDVFVRPSEVEGMPLTILEAMATGLPVVACDVGGVREIVTHGVTGLVVTPGSTMQVANAMLELITDPKMRQEMGGAGLRRVQEGFNWDATATDNLAFFEEVTARTDG